MLEHAQLRIGFIAALALASLCAPAGASSGACDEACLGASLEQVVEGLRGGAAPEALLSNEVEVRENGDRIAFAQSAWRDVAAIHSSMEFADPLTGNALVRSGVELADGSAAYLSTRIHRAENGRITAVEIAADRGQMVQKDYVWNLDPAFAAPVPPELQTPRREMEAIVRRYFNSLGTHVATHEDIDDAACNRFHSGTRITNVPMPGIEGGAMLTCISALEADSPWGPASEQRVPVIDVERGIAVGITLLHYPSEPGEPVMYVTEIFKIVDGRIVNIDNIGLKQDHRDTLGFVE